MDSPTIAKASPDPLPELAAFLAPFSPLFRRTESRESLERYVTGLLTDLSRKNCDTIAAAIAGTSIGTPPAPPDRCRLGSDRPG